MLFEKEKKLEDYQKKHRMINRKDFEKMSYKEKVELFETDPEEYRRLAYQTPQRIQKTTGHLYSSQIRK